MSIAVCESNQPQRSRRQHLLSQDARDVLAWVFEKRLPANETLREPITAAEIKISENDLDSIIYDNDFVKHGDSDSPGQFEHADDDQWALIYGHDCDGNAEMGARIVESYISAVDGPPFKR